MKNLAIGFRLGLAFLLVVCIFLAVSAYRVTRMRALGELQNAMVKRNQDTLSISSVARRLEALYAIVGDAVINGDLERARNDLETYMDQAQMDLRVVATMADTPEEKALAEAFGKNFSLYLSAVKEIGGSL